MIIILIMINVYDPRPQAEIAAPQEIASGLIYYNIIYYNRI